jgi:hypothetical protein
MYVELTDTHFNIMDVDVNTLLAIETVISSTNLDNTELKQERRDKLIELKFRILTEIYSFTNGNVNT